MARFLLLLFAFLAIEAFGQTPDLSRIDQLLDNRYSLRSQSELSFEPSNNPRDIRRNELDTDYESRAKNRRHDDDDHPQMRASRPYGKTSAKSADGGKLVPIPVLLPVLMSQTYPVPIIPVDISTVRRGHQHAFPDHDQERRPLDVHNHQHEFIGHVH
ncbi:uncharacterized protein LOC131664982 isoform X2 [Phymastichus coffea]|uniref:uncharacterized protein LOC131664982 isoform X2 n=1 Tax=Phymastichus coffea TaxID=108790 RepID=UPI00273A9D3D|nr:uncharacterized protein LOC131664982 isoform X2 [Phymastichus coffea]